MHPNRPVLFLLLLTGLLVLGRAFEMDPDELRDHYRQEQLSTVCADPVGAVLPAPVWSDLMPVALRVWLPVVVRFRQWVAERVMVYIEPPPAPRRFRRLCVLQI